MPKNSLRGRVIERWEKADCPQWNCEKTERVCLEEDRKLAEEGCNPARQFRKLVEMEDKVHIRQWVRGCRFPWLTPGEQKNDGKQHTLHAIDPIAGKIGRETMNQNGPLNESDPKGYDAEVRVRRKLEKELGKDLPARTLCVGHRSTGEEIRHEFDLVSEGRSLIGEVKSDMYTKKAHASTRLPRIVLACKYLELAEAEKKMLVLTNKKMYEVLKHDLDGLVSPDIEIIHVDLGKA
jgi:hypothetical protein